MGHRRRRSIRAWPILVAAILCGCAAPEPPPERIVLVLVDTLRRDHVGAYGASAPTPHIDALARAGTVFENAVSSFHATSMSMGALFTGLTPSLESGRADAALDWTQQSWCGLARFAHSDTASCLPAGLRTLGEVMREAGYATIGVTPHALTQRPLGFDRGFEDWEEIKVGARGMLAFRPEKRPQFAALRSGDRVNRAVAEVLDRRRSDRFFLYVHYLDAHDWNLAGVPYAEAVAAADRAVGGLRELLESRGLWRGTAVVLTSDHGEALGEEHFQPASPRHAGNPAFEPVLRVPLIVSGATPDLAPDAFVRSEDVFRLLARLAGVEPEETATLGDEELFVSERVYRTLRVGRWKSYWLRGSDRVRLVDLANDPQERRDVASEHLEIVEAHRARVDALSRELGAPERDVGEILPEHLERLRVLGYLEPAYEVE
jgi:arylsulfatase A-like enzyme